MTKSLTSFQKVLISKIDSLDKGDGCNASNDYLAVFMNSTPNSIAVQLSKLRKLGILETKKFDGRNRWISLKADFTTRSRQTLSHSKGSLYSPLNPPYKDEFKYISNIPPIVPQKGKLNKPKRLKIDNSEDFKQFWKLYPRKIAKKTAYKSWLRIKFNETLTLEKILASLEKHIKYEWNDRPIQAIPHPATWINGDQWENEINKTLNRYFEQRQLDKALNESFEQRQLREEQEFKTRQDEFKKLDDSQPFEKIPDAEII